MVACAPDDEAAEDAAPTPASAAKPAARTVRGRGPSRYREEEYRLAKDLVGVRAGAVEPDDRC